MLAVAMVAVAVEVVLGRGCRVVVASSPVFERS